MIKTNIVNCLLTRRCNLACPYCQISGNINHPLKPVEYPDEKYYFENEKPIEWWIKTLTGYWRQNPDCFFILYGGEPFIRGDLSTLVKHLNVMGAHYTIITNCTMKKRIEDLFEDVSRVDGFTASIDPGAEKIVLTSREDVADDERWKSALGFRTLKELMNQGVIRDPVAEMTCDAVTISHLENTVKFLSDEGIVADITMIDITKNNYYDFSNVTSPMALVKPTPEVIAIFERLQESDLLIHMKDFLLPGILSILPANGDCELEKGIHNVTIDADGNLRLCLRIRGRFTPKFSADELYDINGVSKTYSDIQQAIAQDKESLCKKCCWSCVLMSKSDDCDGIINH